MILAAVVFEFTMPFAASSAEGRAASNAAEKACAEDAKANIQFLRLRRDAVMILTAVIFEFTMPIAASSAEGRAASNDAAKKQAFLFSRKACADAKVCIQFLRL